MPQQQAAPNHQRFRPHLSLRQIRKTPHEGARFDRRWLDLARGIANSIHGVRPSALRAPGPACGCPNSFRTNLSLAEAGCRSEQQRSCWPGGRGTGCAESPEVSSTPRLSARYAKRPARGRFDRRWVDLTRGIANSIHGVRPSALRAPGPACGCPNSFRTNLSNQRLRPHLSLRQIRKTPREGAFCVSGGERGIRTLDKAFDPILP